MEYRLVVPNVRFARNQIERWAALAKPVPTVWQRVWSWLLAPV